MINPRQTEPRPRGSGDITFGCYGARLHGDESGSVDRSHNLVGGPRLAPDAQRVMAERREMRGWNLLAAHVRSNHVHAIVESETPPERIMHEFKSYASRELKRLGADSPECKRWARHGSTRWLWRDEDVRIALQYVIDEQGAFRALFVAKEIERDPQLSAPLRSRLGIEP